MIELTKLMESGLAYTISTKSSISTGVGGGGDIQCNRFVRSFANSSQTVDKKI